jgi:hypothetical protein
MLHQGRVGFMEMRDPKFEIVFDLESDLLINSMLEGMGKFGVSAGTNGGCA